jgi:class 3 adenylate cyclase
MINKTRVWLFVAFFAVLNLCFIPLLSLYGLRVCPVLSIPGFGFGCYYAAVFVGGLLVLNSGLILTLTFLRTESRIVSAFLNHTFLCVAAVYVISSAFALIFLQFQLRLNHLAENSRAPEVLLFASLMLGITQGYGLTWAFHGARPGRAVSRAGQSIARGWAMQILRTMFPILVVSAVLLHFLISQSLTFNSGHTAPQASGDELISQTSYLIYFLLAWLAVTFLLHFQSERDQVRMVRLHLDAMSESLETKYRSETFAAWGLWKTILDQLNGFSQIMNEKARLLTAFSKFVTAGVAKDVLNSESLSLSGEMKDMTVLMVDIRGFTALSESMSPNQVVELLNAYFSAMLAVVSKLDVTVDKFIGDGILAYVDSGDSSGGSSEAENRIAVDAALKMLVATESLNQTLVSRGLPPIQIGVGIYRGSLIIGLVGTDSKMQHTIIGDTVNRVARLEGLCKDLGVPIVLSGWIWHSLDIETKAKFRSFGKKSVKGIAESMDIFGGPVS